MKLHTKSDFTALMHRFLDPLLPLYSEGGARLHLGDTGVTYPGRTIEMEAFSRPLWALAPFWTGGGRADDFLRIYRKGLASGTDPESPEYWGDPNDYDQLFVEMAALACAILETPESVWEPLTDAEKALVTNYDVLVEAEAEYARLAAEQGNQFLVYDFNDLLRWRKAFQDLGIGRLFGDGLDEILRDLEVDVRLEQRHADLTHSLLDVGLGQTAFASQMLKRR